MQDVLATDTNTQAAALRELADLRARRAQIESDLAERTAPDVNDEIERERRALADAEGLRALLDAGEVLDKTIRVIVTSVGNVVVKKCSAMRYRKFQDAGDFDTQATERLVRPNVVYPALEVFDRMLEDAPMIVFDCGNAMAWLAGIRKQAVEKK